MVSSQGLRIAPCGIVPGDRPERRSKVLFTATWTKANLFLGWFGPRGLASLVFAIIVYNTDLPNKEILGMVVVCTVFLSAILHGVTAVPLANALAARVARPDGDAGK